jgi:hypothetical protein
MLILLVGCSGSGSPPCGPVYADVPCVDNAATHDFGTTDPRVLARVVAFEPLVSPPYSGVTAMNILWHGSVANVACATGTVTFVLLDECGDGGM